MNLDKQLEELKKVEDELKETRHEMSELADEICTGEGPNKERLAAYSRAYQKAELLSQDKEKIQKQIFEAKRENLLKKKKEARFWEKGSVKLELTELELEEQNVQIDMTEEKLFDSEQIVRVSGVAENFYEREVDRINEENKGLSPAQILESGVREAMDEARGFERVNRLYEANVKHKTERLAELQEQKKETEAKIARGRGVQGFVNGFKGLVSKSKESFMGQYSKLSDALNHKLGRMTSQERVDKIREIRAQIAELRQAYEIDLPKKIEGLQAEADRLKAEVEAGGSHEAFIQLQEVIAQESETHNDRIRLHSKILDLQRQEEALSNGKQLPREETVAKTDDAPVVEEETVAKTDDAPVIEEETVIKTDEAPVIDEAEAFVGESASGETGVDIKPVQNKQESDNALEISEYMAAYAHKYAEYYANGKGTRGNAHSKEELAAQRKLNAAMKKFISKRVEKYVAENGIEDQDMVSQISDPVEVLDIEALTQNDAAMVKLFQIASNGVYEKDGQRVRLTRKQKIALSNVLVKVSEKKAERESKKMEELERASKNELSGAGVELGEEE